MSLLSSPVLESYLTLGCGVYFTPGMRSPYPPGAPRHPLDLGQPGIRPPPDYLSNLMRQQAAGGLPGAAAAAQQLAGHDALQRQLMFERERGLLGAAQQAQQAQQAAAAAAGSQSLAASQHLQQLQMEEYHRLLDNFISIMLTLNLKISGLLGTGR